jgi:hypothetical protein
MEGLPIKDTMLSDMCPDVESAFCFPHKVSLKEQVLEICLLNRPDLIDRLCCVLSEFTDFTVSPEIGGSGNPY